MEWILSEIINWVCSVVFDIRRIKLEFVLLPHQQRNIRAGQREQPHKQHLPGFLSIGVWYWALCEQETMAPCIPGLESGRFLSLAGGFSKSLRRTPHAVHQSRGVEAPHHWSLAFCDQKDCIMQEGHPSVSQEAICRDKTTSRTNKSLILIRICSNQTLIRKKDSFCKSNHCSIFNIQLLDAFEYDRSLRIFRF